ncbi:MAG: hypothetical protein ACOCXJ_09180, partial [Planctomycetota bacterium]
MSHRIRIVWACCLLLTAARLTAVELETLERYILSEDRAAALELFVLGSDEWYYHKALLLQQAGELDPVDALIDEWRRTDRQSGPRRIIEHRQAFLRAGNDPAGIDRHLQQFVHLPDDPRARSAREAALPAALEQQWTPPGERLRTALERRNSVPAAGLRRAIRQRLVPDAVLYEHAARDPQRWPRLVDLLGGRNPMESAWQALAPFCTIEELERLRAGDRRVALQVDELLIEKHLALAGDWADLADEQRLELLRAIAPLAEQRPEARLQVAHHRLATLHALGRVQAADILAYLREPRPVPRLRPVDRRRDRVGFPWNACPLPPITGDAELVEAVLDHAFRDDRLRPEQVGTLIGAEYARQLHAEAKATSGQGAAAAWARVLGEEAWQELRERRELAWQPGLPRHLPPGEPPELRLVTKHPGMLELRVFRLDTEQVRRSHGAGLPTEIDLDGLVPTARRQLQAPGDPMLRKGLAVPVPEVDGRGLWV